MSPAQRSEQSSYTHRGKDEGTYRCLALQGINKVDQVTQLLKH